MPARLHPLQPSRCSCCRDDTQQDLLPVSVSSSIRHPACSASSYMAAMHNMHHLADSMWGGSLCSQESHCCQDTITIQPSHRMKPLAPTGFYSQISNTRSETDYLNTKGNVSWKIQFWLTFTVKWKILKSHCNVTLEYNIFWLPTPVWDWFYDSLAVLIFIQTFVQYIRCTF